MYVIVENAIVKTIHVDSLVFERSIEAPDDIVFGDRYENGEWVRCGERPEQSTGPVERTPEERIE